MLDDDEWTEAVLVAMLQKANYITSATSFIQPKDIPGIVSHLQEATAFMDGAHVVPELTGVIARLESPGYKFEYHGRKVVAVVTDETAEGITKAVGRLELEYVEGTFALVTKSWEPS